VANAIALDQVPQAQDRVRFRWISGGAFLRVVDGEHGGLAGRTGMYVQALLNARRLGNFFPFT